MPHQCTDCGRGFEDGSKEMLSGCPNCGGTTFQFQPEGIDEETVEDSPSPPDPPESEVDSTVARTVGNAATAVRDFMGSESRSAGSPRDGPEPQSTPNSQPSASTSTHSSPDEPSVSSGTAETQQSTPQESSRSPADSSGSDGDTTPSEEYVQPPGSPNGDSSRGSTPRGGNTPDSHPNASHSQDDSSDSGGIAADSSSQEDSAQASARSEVVPSDDLPPAPDTPVREPPAPADDTSALGDDQVPSRGDDQPDLEELREQLNEQFESIRVLAPGQYELNLMELYDREEYIIALQEDGKYTIQVPERWKD